MASDYFLKIEGIKGESQDHKHKDEIDLVSWSWGLSQTGTSSFGGGGGAGKAHFTDATFTHKLDFSSARLAQACATGEHIKSATFVARKAGKEQQEYFNCKFTDLLITSVSPAGSHGDDVPHENVSINFAKIDMEYKVQKEDGTLGAGIKFGYDLKANKQH